MKSGRRKGEEEGFSVVGLLRRFFFFVTNSKLLILNQNNFSFFYADNSKFKTLRFYYLKNKNKLINNFFFKLKQVDLNPYHENNSLSFEKFVGSINTAFANGWNCTEQDWTHASIIRRLQKIFFWSQETSL